MYVYSNMRGAKEPYLRKFRTCARNWPLLSANHGAIKGWISFNLDSTYSLKLIHFTMAPNILYFKFISLHLLLKNWKLDKRVNIFYCIEIEHVTLTTRKLRQEYEVVFTTSSATHDEIWGGFHNIYYHPRSRYGPSLPKISWLNRIIPFFSSLCYCHFNIIFLVELQLLSIFKSFHIEQCLYSDVGVFHFSSMLVHILYI